MNPLSDLTSGPLILSIIIYSPSNRQNEEVDVKRYKST